VFSCWDRKRNAFAFAIAFDRSIREYLASISSPADPAKEPERLVVGVKLRIERTRCAGQTTAGLQCSLVKTHRIEDAVRYEQVAGLGLIPASPSVADRLAFWRRVYEALAELASGIDADTQGKIISAVHSRIPIVTPNGQRALRVRSRPQPEKAPRHEGAKERAQNKVPTSGTDAGTLPFPRVPSLPTAEYEGMHTEHAEVAEDRTTQAENSKSLESGFGKPMTVEEFTTVVVHLLQYTPFR
jgi:hypothetical protein